MITRERCEKLIEKYVTTPWLKLHMKESDIIMQAVANRLGGHEEKWGLAGLLHDLDFDYVGKDPDRHVVEFDDILKMENLEVGKDIDQDVYHAIKAHYEDNPRVSEKRENNLDYDLTASENLSGFLVSCALVMPDKKIASVTSDTVLRKLKKKEFAKAVRRDLIQDIEETGISLEEFVDIALDAMKARASELGL
jgi:predicted hydrolase (HD superfamily)